MNGYQLRSENVDFYLIVVAIWLQKLLNTRMHFICFAQDKAHSFLLYCWFNYRIKT
ncbi:hypothetical protein OKW21_003475 [Catalinimonas alkaloidigena]|nr:hypothetical protein [Catalinimonas alkaloidigena]